MDCVTRRPLRKNGIRETGKAIFKAMDAKGLAGVVDGQENPVGVLVPILIPILAGLYTP